MSEKLDKIEQVLLIEPKSELHFRGPYNEIVTEYLTLINLSDERICFKIKTTAPKRYCVRPNSGIIQPKTSKKIAVMLQPFELDSNQIAEFKNKHKFMVQTMLIPDGDFNQETLWKDVDSLFIKESKLKCVFDMEPFEKKDNELINMFNQYNLTKSKEDTGIGKTDPSINSADSSFAPNKRGNDYYENLIYENNKLEDEILHLKQELLQAKEEGLRNRINKAQLGLNETEVMDKNFDENLNVGIKNNSHILAIAFIIFLLGILFGKIFY